MLHLPRFHDVSVVLRDAHEATESTEKTAPRLQSAVAVVEPFEETRLAGDGVELVGDGVGLGADRAGDPSDGDVGARPVVVLQRVDDLFFELCRLSFAAVGRRIDDVRLVGVDRREHLDVADTAHFDLLHAVAVGGDLRVSDANAVALAHVCEWVGLPFSDVRQDVTVVDDVATALLPRLRVKLLGDGELTKKLQIDLGAVSRGAASAVVAAGGSVKGAAAEESA